MRVLLTGVTGFVGQSLMPLLLAKCPNSNIMTLNTNIEEAEYKFPYSQYIQCKHVHVSNIDEVVQFNPEIVLHLATLTTPRNDTDIIQSLISANINFGVLLLDTLSKCSAMKLFVNTGSFAEYSLGSDNFNSAYLYAASKTAFRSFVSYYSDLCGFKYITAVPYTIYGGNMTVKRLIDYIKESIDSPIPVKMSTGKQVLDFIHVTDVANFYVSIVANLDQFLSLKNNGEEFYIGTGKGTCIRDLVLMIENKYKKKCNIKWGETPYRERDIMYAVAPIDRNNQLVKWKPSIDLFDGI